MSWKMSKKCHPDLSKSWLDCNRKQLLLFLVSFSFIPFLLLVRLMPYNEAYKMKGKPYVWSLLDSRQ
jgi:hypothetical protein